MKNLHKGGKVTRSHTTYITAAKSLLYAAKEMPEVKKISLGIIKVAKCTPGMKVVEDCPSVVKLTVRSNSAIQTIYLYLQSPSEFEKVKTNLMNLH